MREKSVADTTFERKGGNGGLGGALQLSSGSSPHPRRW